MINVKRVLAKYLDLIIILIFSILLITIFDLQKISNIKWYTLLKLFFYLTSDLIFLNKSLFKKIFKIQVLTCDDRIPKKKILIFRNLFDLGIINSLLSLITGKSIGDYLFKTKVVQIYTPATVKPLNNSNKLFLFKKCILLFLSIILCLIYTFFDIAFRLNL